jgi:hypothetical protein
MGHANNTKRYTAVNTERFRGIWRPVGKGGSIQPARAHERDRPVAAQRARAQPLVIGLTDFLSRIATEAAMSMFDYYRPASEQRCPVCTRILREWQGKDGPNGLFVWAEGCPFPVEQLVSDDVRIDQAGRERLRLPARFIIYSYDCPDHQPIEADCIAPNDIWVRTFVRPYGRPQRT